MRKEILFEKFEIPSEIDANGMMRWHNKRGVLHRGYYRPAIIDKEKHAAHFYVNGKYIRTININSIEDQIQEIMKEFDFEIVHRTMFFLDWTWLVGVERIVPDLNELKKSALDLLKGAAEEFYNSDEKDQCFYGSGGLMAYCDNYGMKLEFILSDWETNINW